MDISSQIPPIAGWEDRRLYVIFSPIMGYYVKMINVHPEWSGRSAYRDIWADNIDEAMPFQLRELRIPQDANARGLLSILVCDYTGLQLIMI